MQDIVIRAEGLGKKFLIGHQHQHQAEGDPYHSLRDAIARGARSIARKAKDMALGRPIVEGDRLEDVWALRDLDFEVKRGDVVGVIGRNGAGKSTLLKILSRITEPSEGRCTIEGRLASLLEIGTGFHPELSGRENIYLNGAILGMSRAEIRRKFDEIVAFAEISRYLDTPVKRYSSGMYVRLAFAVAAHLEPEILVVDEVLAVGDMEFQKKCLGKMADIARGGRTVLFVSHNLGAVRALCGQAILLEQGRLVRLGPSEEVVSAYLDLARAPRDGAGQAEVRLGSALTLNALSFEPATIASCGPARFRVELAAKAAVRIEELAILIYSDHGARIALIDLRKAGLDRGLGEGERIEFSGSIESMPFVEGHYSAGLFIETTDYGGNFLDLASFGVAPLPASGGVVPYPAQHRGYVELGCTVSVSTQAASA